MLTSLFRHAAMTVLVCSLAACGSDTTAPTKKTTLGSSVTGTTGAVSSEPSDTTHLASGPANISGHVILITVTPSNGQPVDTSHTAPLAGARLSLSTRVRNGENVVLEPYGSVVADAAGAFVFTNVPAGYYVLKAEGPAGTSYPAAQAYIATSVSEIALEFRLVTGM